MTVTASNAPAVVQSAPPRARFRPPWWREVALVALAYGAYTLTRNTLPAHEAIARAHAMDLYRIERHLHLDAEAALNGFATRDLPHLLSLVVAYTYSLAHELITIGVLCWLYLRHPGRYRGARTMLVAVTLIGLVGFWLFPTAPPRFFPALGFADTVVRDHTWGSWASNSVAQMSNQYAAMPSIHVAWSLWCATWLWRCVRQRWVRALAVAYPVGIAAVVLLTANHWVLDVLAGVLTVALAAGVSVGLAALLARLSGVRRSGGARRAAGGAPGGSAAPAAPAAR